VTVNFWFDGPVMDQPFIGLVGGPMHWVFDKSAIFGSAAGHLSIVASGARDLAAMDNASVTREALAHLSSVLPAAASRRLLRSIVVREHRATFSLAPGGPPRPPALTLVPGFFLAGDWTDTGLPGTIEAREERAPGGLVLQSLQCVRCRRSSSISELALKGNRPWFINARALDPLALAASTHRHAR
jgi:hypothetical protein